MPRRSRASAADGRGPPPPPANPVGLALGWLGLRELSAPGAPAAGTPRSAGDGLDKAIERLVARGALDDGAWRWPPPGCETVIRGRGPARTRQKLRALGLPDAASDAALDAALADVDVDALLDRALAERLRGLPAGPLDAAATRRLVSALVRQGFDAGARSRACARAPRSPSEADD